MQTIRTHLVQIGNSRGVRIPKPLLEHSGLTGEVEISFRSGGLLIRPSNSPRAGWEEQFRAPAEKGDDRLLDPPTPTRWDLTEWKW